MKLQLTKKVVVDEIFWNLSGIKIHGFKLKIQLLNNNDGLIDLKKAMIKKEISEHKNQNQMLDIVEKILAFNKQQKVKKLEY